MKKRLALISGVLLALTACSSPEIAEIRLLVGTYTDGTDSEGIYLFDFNQNRGTWNLLDTARAWNPSFIIPSPSGDFAYAVGEFNDGGQRVYTCALTDDTVDVLGWTTTDGTASGADPCNVIEAGGSVFTSNYFGGTLSAFAVGTDGILGSVSDQFVPGEDSLGRPSHIHCAALSPEGKYLFVTDLGLDILYRFTVGGPSEPLQDARVAFRFDSDERMGPRHLVFGRDGRYAYLIHELGDFLTTFTYNDGKLEHISTQKAYEGDGHGSADIHISPDGCFLYTSHRVKDDGISVFRINEKDGEPEKVGYCRTGKHPRNFAITPDGRYLLCACRDAGCIEIYAIDGDTGLLEDTGMRIPVPSPACIQCLDVD